MPRMLRFSIVLRIATGFIATLTLTMVVSGFVVEQALRRTLESDLANLTTEKLNAVSHIAEDQVAFPTRDQLHAIDDLLSGHPDMTVVLKTVNAVFTRGAQPSEDLLANLEQTLVTSSPKALDGGKHVVLRRDIRDVAYRPFTVFVLASTQATQERLSAYRQIIVVATFAALLAGIVLALFAARWTMAPLSRLTRHIGRLDPAQLSQRLPISNDAVELGAITGAVNHCLDRIERAYVQTEAFNADVAHELRTPLAATRLAVETALGNRSSDEVVDLLAGALDQIDSLNTIVADMLFVSQAQRGAQARKEWVEDGKGFLQSISEFWEPLALDSGLTLEVKGTGTLWLDASLVRRAVSNLISNALRYSRVGSVVEVELEATSEQWRISVTNVGEAIPPDVQMRMFDRFYRADPSRSATATNHGLGLAIVAAVGKMHGGEPFVNCQGGLVRVGLKAANRTFS
jgi:two-component system, OmpR family, heavy metal sensor histidine kinase CusS